MLTRPPVIGPRRTFQAGLRLLAVLLLHGLDVQLQQLLGLPHLFPVVQGPLKGLLEVLDLALREVQRGSQLRARNVRQGLGRAMWFLEQAVLKSHEENDTVVERHTNY